MIFSIDLGHIYKTLSLNNIYFPFTYYKLALGNMIEVN